MKQFWERGMTRVRETSVKHAWYLAGLGVFVAVGLVAMFQFPARAPRPAAPPTVAADGAGPAAVLAQSRVVAAPTKHAVAAKPAVPQKATAGAPSVSDTKTTPAWRDWRDWVKREPPKEFAACHPRSFTDTQCGQGGG